MTDPPSHPAEEACRLGHAVTIPGARRLAVTEFGRTFVSSLDCRIGVRGWFVEESA
jgi:hypothetical protein